MTKQAIMRWLLAASLLLLIINGCMMSGDQPAQLPPPVTIEQTPFEEIQEPLLTEETQQESEVDPLPAEALFMAVGDVMMHMPQLPAYYDKASGSYDFSPYFEKVAPILSRGDWTLANLETPLSDDGKYSGFPLFNAPHELAKALKESGFSIVTFANNHTLDKGEQGVLRTLEALKQQDLITKGSAASAEEAAEQTIIEKNGIKLGLLAYTYGTNGIPVPTGKPYLVSLMNEEQMITDINELKAAGADVVAVALHFGTEYQFMPSEEQKRIARKLAAEGADIIAGSHPHVIQPYEVVETAEADGTFRKSVIMYSLGNFISNQRGDTKDYGLIFQVKLRKEKGKTYFTELEPIITWVHRYRETGANRYRILPVEETLLKRKDTLLSSKDYLQLEKDLKLLNKRLSAFTGH